MPKTSGSGGGSSSSVPQLVYYMADPTGVAATDTAAINTAIASAYNTIVFRPGTYLTNATVHLASNKTLLGSSRGTTTIKAADNTNLAYMFDSTTALTGVEFNSLTLDANYQNQVSGANAVLDTGVAQGGISSSYIRQCTLKNTRNPCLNFYNGASDWEVSDCTFTTHFQKVVNMAGPGMISRYKFLRNTFQNYNQQNTASGNPAFQCGATSKTISTMTWAAGVATVTTSTNHGYVTGHVVLVSGADQREYNGFQTVTVTGATTYTFPLVPTPTTPATGTMASSQVVTDVIIEGNTFAPALDGTPKNGFALEWISAGNNVYHYGFTITGNTFDGNKGVSTGISGAVSNSTIVGNTWKRGIPGNHRGGIELVGNDNTVTGNSIFDGKIAVTAVGGYTITPSNICISGNSISNVSVSDIGISAIEFNKVDDISITNNVISFLVSGTATVQSGIYVGVYGSADVVQRVLIKGNLISGAGSAANSGNGIRVLPANGSNNIQIVENKISFMSNGIVCGANANVTDMVVAYNELQAGNTTPINTIPTGKGISFYANKITSGEGYQGGTQLKTSAYTALVTDDQILCDTGTGFTVTLPPWPTQGQTLKIKKITTDVNTLTIAHNQTLLENAVANLTTAATTRPTFHLQNRQRSQTATITIATPGVVSATAHGLVAGCAVVFATTSALPTGITAGTIYYVIATGLTANAFQFSATVGGAAVNTSGTQSGTHTIISNAWWQL